MSNLDSLIRNNLDMPISEDVSIYKDVENRKKFTNEITKTPDGVFISSDDLSNECLEQIEKYVVFCLDQLKRIE